MTAAESPDFQGAMDADTKGQATAKLVFRSGQLRGNVLAIEKDRVSIGRDGRNDVAIRDAAVSGFHAAIIREPDGTFWLEDLGSKNGTFVGDKAVTRVQLHDGDAFCLCRTGPEIQFTQVSPTLPSILESTAATLIRTRSLRLALGEMVPRRVPSDLLTLTGVRRIVDYKLEEASRRSRRLWVAFAAGLLVAGAAGIGGVALYLARSPARAAGAGAAAARPPESPPVKLAARLDAIYGSLFLSYRDQPIGEAEVANEGDDPLTGGELAFRFRDTAAGFLVEPWSVAVPPIAPRSVARVPITPKLSAEVLSDQTREVTGTVTLLVGGRPVTDVTRAVFVHARNVMSWEKPEHAAAFIDPNDPAIAAFLRAAWTQRPPSGRSEFPPANVVAALTLISALAELGLAYLPDAANPASERVDARANDRVGYPGETLLARSGDCDDLSVLACAVLEAARIPTALAVGTSHVLFLFDSGVRAPAISDTPLDPAHVVAWKGKAWIPIEATDLARRESGFASAWAAAWPRIPAIAAGEMKLVDVEDAWRSCRPMNPPPDEPARRRIAAIAWTRDGFGSRVEAALDELRTYFRKALDRRVEEIDRSRGTGPARDLEVGILYARSGLFDDARKLLERAAFGEKGPPPDPRPDRWADPVGEDLAVILSDLAFCICQAPRSPGDLDRAAAYGELALRGVPDAATDEKGELLVRLALVHRLRGDLAAERSFSETAFRLDPALAPAWQKLVGTAGPVSGPEENVLVFLREGIGRTLAKKKA